MAPSTKRHFGLTGEALSILQIALVVAPSFILFGYNQAGVGGLLTLADWVKTFPAIDTVNTTGDEEAQNSTLQGFTVAIFVIGALIGSLTCSYTGDKFGRRNVIFGAAVLTLIGEILECTSWSLAQFMVGRIILGAGVGMLSTIVPVWQAETSGAKNRGKHVVLTGLFTCLGFVLESWINLAFFTLPEGPATWRPPIAIACLFSIILMASTYLFPESPRWLVLKNRKEEAAAALAAYRGLPADSFKVQTEISGVEVSLEETLQHATKLTDILRMGEDKLAYRFGLCILLQFFQQMSGSNLISVYAPILFQDNLGMSPMLSRILSGGALTWKFLASFMAFFCIERFGRRFVFIVSGTGMSACMVALAVATSFPTDNYAAQVTAGCFIYLYNTFVPIGFLGANFLYCSEIAPLRMRMAMSSISTANHWLWNFVVVMATPVAIKTIGWQYYIVFAVIAACVPLSVYFFFPETKGRNLEEIDIMFRNSPSAWATARFAKNRPIGMPKEFAHNEKKGEKHDLESASVTE